MNKKISYPEPKRLEFPEEEKKNQWLPWLLDAYFIADKGIREAIIKRLSKGEKLACAKGCSNCCEIHNTIPVYPLEVVGIYWYVIEKLKGDARDRLRIQLKEFVFGEPCPFLIDGVCIIHPMRPLACRYFNVFNKPCEKGEDPYYTRRHDVLAPIEKYKNKALSLMLPFHGITQRAKRKQAVKEGYLNRLVQNLHEIDWKKLASRMEGKVFGLNM